MRVASGFGAHIKAGSCGPLIPDSSGLHKLPMNAATARVQVERAGEPTWPGRAKALVANVHGICILDSNRLSRGTHSGTHSQHSRGTVS